jgi:hypothetical protein
MNSVRRSVTQRGALTLHSHAARGNENRSARVNENTSENKQQVWQQQTCEVLETSQVLTLTLNRVNTL